MANVENIFKEAVPLRLEIWPLIFFDLDISKTKTIIICRIERL